MTKIDIRRRFTELGHLVGNTPLLAIDYSYKGEPRRIYAKAENFNLTASIKDRMALYVLRKAYESRTLEPFPAASLLAGLFRDKASRRSSRRSPRAPR